MSNEPTPGAAAPPPPPPNKTLDPARSLDRGPLVLLGRVLGSLGTVALLSTILTYVLTRELGWMIYGKLIFGGVSLLIYLVTSKDELGRFFGARSTAYSAASWVKILAFLLVMTGVSYITATQSKEYDLTPNQIYSISDQTQKVVKALEVDVEILGFYRPEEPDRALLESLIGRYRELSPRVTLTMINPEKEPDLAKKWEITESGARIVVRAGEREAKVKTFGEEGLTNALVKVGQTNPKRIVFLIGHGEADTLSQAAEGFQSAVTAIQDEGYIVEVLSLLDKNAMPEGIGLMIIANPKTPLLPTEIEVLHGYLLRGGHLMVLLEPGQDGGLKNFLSDWRIGLAEDVVLDASSTAKAFGFGPEMPIVQNLEDHPITKDLKAAVAFPSARSITAQTGAIEGVTAKPVVKASAQSWGETNYQAGGTAVLETEDLAGPVGLMAASTKKPKVMASESSQSRLVVAGDHEFANNRFLGVLGNRDLFLNAINWLAQEEGKISIRPRQRGASRLLMTEGQANFVKFFSIDIVPMVLLAVGVAVWHVRRRK